MVEPTNSGANQVPRRPNGQFAPGARANPNPAGRPKGNLEALAREKTHNGLELLEFWLTTMRDEKQKMDYRLRAAESVATWGFAKPKDGTEHDISDRLFALLKRINNTD